MERAVQVLAVIHFTVIGLSHVVRPGVWASFFSLLRERGEAGVFIAAFIALTFGSLVVGFHNVWTGLPVVLTLLGWAQVIKALVYFVFPAYGLRKLQLASDRGGRVFVPPGILFLVLAAVLTFHLLRGT